MAAKKKAAVKKFTKNGTAREAATRGPVSKAAAETTSAKSAVVKAAKNPIDYAHGRVTVQMERIATTITVADVPARIEGAPVPAPKSDDKAFAFKMAIVPLIGETDQPSDPLPSDTPEFGGNSAPMTADTPTSMDNFTDRRFGFGYRFAALVALDGAQTAAELIMQLDRLAGIETFAPWKPDFDVTTTTLPLRAKSHMASDSTDPTEADSEESAGILPFLKSSPPGG